MAHWAELDDTNKVIRVIVADPDDGADGTIHPPAFCTDVLGGTWVRTYYDTEGQVYAGVGATWDAATGAFTPREPEVDMDEARLAAVEEDLADYKRSQAELNATMVDEDSNLWDALDGLG